MAKKDDDTNWTCGALFGHDWVLASYQDPRQIAKGKYRFKCAKIGPKGQNCAGSKTGSLPGGNRVTVIDGKGRRKQIQTREINSWAGGSLEAQLPTQKAKKKDGTEVTSKVRKRWFGKG
jgi:hypothetical protein